MLVNEGNIRRARAVRRNIWKAAIGEVGKSTEILSSGWADVVVQIGGYRVCLVTRALEVIAETSGSGIPCDFRTDRLSAAHCCDVWTCTWELRRKLWRLFAIVGLTRCTNA